MKPKLIVFTDN